MKYRHSLEWRIWKADPLDEGFIMLMNDVKYKTGQRRTGVARPDLTSLWEHNRRNIIMINNSSLKKWDRLSQKQLDQQFTHEIVHGMQCSPFEATAILDTVYQVYAPYFETSGTLKPGQILFQVVSVEVAPNDRLADCKQVTVTLTFDAGQEDLDVRRSDGIQALRRHRMQRMTVEAFQQGGLFQNFILDRYAIAPRQKRAKGSEKKTEELSSAY